MKIKKIAIVFITLVFFVSSTGVALVHNVCSMCNIDHKHTQEQSCCEKKKPTSNNCKDNCKSDCSDCSKNTTVLYLKITEPFVNEIIIIDFGFSNFVKLFNLNENIYCFEKHSRFLNILYFDNFLQNREISLSKLCCLII